MRTIYLTLAFFMLLGIVATCRTPPLVAGDTCDNAASSDTCQALRATRSD